MRSFPRWAKKAARFYVSSSDRFWDYRRNLGICNACFLRASPFPSAFANTRWRERCIKSGHRVHALDMKPAPLSCAMSVVFAGYRHGGPNHHTVRDVQIAAYGINLGYGYRLRKSNVYYYGVRGVGTSRYRTCIGKFTSWGGEFKRSGNYFFVWWLSSWSDFAIP
jgi:hypothetical protein